MDFQALYAQAAAAQKSGNPAEAERLYRAILANAAIPEAMVNYANLLARLGRGGEALIQYDRALQARPDFFEAHFNRANLLLEMKRFEDAAAGFDRAVTARGDVPGAWNNRGTALRGLRRFAEALESYHRAVTLAPDHVGALTNRAIALFDLQRLGEALAAADRALAAQPGFAEALYIKGNILRDMSRLPDAQAAYEQAHGQPHALNGAAQMSLALCDWERTAALAPRLKEAVEARSAVVQPFVLLGYSDDAGLQRRCAENYVRRVAPAQAPLSDGKPYGHDKIRLAYLSADFHQHPTAQLMAELFERHDRSRFEVTAIAFGPDDGSAMRTRLVRAFDRFEDVRAMSDLEVARLLRAREIDIAVDLNGHTEGARPGIFAHRPVPVQVNYLVYPGTSGASYMTHILADRIVLPPEHQVFCSEKIAYLPDCYQANDAKRLVGDAPTRAETGLPEEGFVFCCFNNGWKITAPVFGIWMRLLAQVDGSVLWLLDGPHAANLRAAATAHGIDTARLIFAPKIDAAAHLARHRLADLFLDTLPYNAHTTASDALWAGVPVVTEIGKAFAGRVAASLLKSINLPELVTANASAYEALALDLAKNPAALKATREKLARGRATTPLYDSATFVREIETAYTTMLG
jgi:predicted O-linked N-acetylglucosamine transferase (SPINDLY family)